LRTPWEWPSPFAQPVSTPRSTRTGRITASFSREWRIGRIHEIHGGPEHLRWFWAPNGALDKPADLRTDDHVASLEEAKVQLRESWRTWLTWAGLSEVE
jgi:hypothetical protein